MTRFFKRSKNVDGLTTKQVDEFLYKEQLIGKVTPERVKDFYNALSSVMLNEGIEEEEIDYRQFDCKTVKDEKNIDKVRDNELSYLKHINKDLMNDSRLLKVACAATYKYEQGVTEGNDVNGYIRSLIRHYEENEGENDECTFGEMLELDISFMKYLALLSTKRAFAKTGTKLVKNVAGSTIKHTPLENFSDIFNMDLIDSMRPDFKRQLATKDLYVKTRYNKQERAQNLIIMVDDSGSMNLPVKKAMLQAALTLKLRDFSENHNIYIGTFICEVFGFMKIEKGTRFKDLDFIKLNKGSTDVNGCLKKTISMIEERRLTNIRGGYHTLSDNHFEILIVNDGEDKVDPTFHPTIKTHALCLMQNNMALKNVCHRSSGTYHYLTDDNS